MDIVILLLGVSILLVILYIFLGDDKATIGRKQKIAALMLYDENIKDYGDICYEINKKYCEKYDIELIKEYNKKYTDRIPTWQKPPMVLEYMKNYDYVIWIDADAFFYLDVGDIRNVINMYKDKNIIFSKDYLNEEINAGFFIVKNCKESIDFVNKWAYDEDVFNNSQYGHDPIQGDQGGLTNMYNANEFGIKGWSVRIDYGVLQHFPALTPLHTLKEKPYVCHMADNKIHNRYEIAKQYYDGYKNHIIN